MSGGSPQTTVSQNGPPQVFLDAYGRVVNRAEQVAATPYEAYPGQTVAGFSPDQTAAMGVVRGRARCNVLLWRFALQQARQKFVTGLASLPPAGAAVPPPTAAGRTGP